MTTGVVGVDHVKLVHVHAKAGDVGVDAFQRDTLGEGGLLNTGGRRMRTVMHRRWIAKVNLGDTRNGGEPGVLTVRERIHKALEAAEQDQTTETA